MDISTRKLHPLVAIAAVSVLIFSVIGSAKMLGWLPAVEPAIADAPEPATTVAPVAEVAQAPLAKEQWHAIEPAEPKVVAAPTPKPTVVTPKPVVIVSKPSHTVRVAEVRQRPIQYDSYNEYGYKSPAIHRPKHYPSCVGCGIVTSIRPIAAAQHGPSGVGALVGAIAGGVIGHQIGGGNGRKIATAAGAIGGAYAGNRYEGGRVKGYEMSIRLDSGKTRNIHYSKHPGFYAGDKIRLAGGHVIRR